MRHSPSRIERASSRMSSRSDSTPSSLGQATHCDDFLTEAAGRVDIHPPASLFTASTGCGSPSVPGRTKGHFSAPMRDSMQHPGYGLPRTVQRVEKLLRALVWPPLGGRELRFMVFW